MKKLFTLKTLMSLLLLFVGVNAWGTDVVYKTALFGSSYNSAGVSSYTGTFSSTNNEFTVNLANFNNNNNGWSFAKCGRKGNASVATITTNAAIDKAITKVVVTIDAVTATNVNSIKLYSGTSSSSITTEEGSFTAATGTQTVTISSPAANKYYKIAFDCKSGSGNGFVTVSKVEYYKVEEAAKAYTVTFNAGTNGTCGCSDTENHQLTEASANAGVTLPSCTPNSGYNFVGWSTTDGGTSANAGAAGATYHPTSNCTLYAVYKQYYTLTITQPSEGGTLTVKDGETPLSSGAQVNVGTNLTCEVTNIPEGKRFSRFYAEWDNSQSKYKSTNPATFDNIATENITALAVRVAYQDLAQYTINYMVNGQNTNPQENVWEGTALAFPTPSAIYGKNFVGWTETPIDGTTNDEPTLVSTAGLKASANKTYYAVFATVTAGTGTKKTDNITRAVTGVSDGSTSYTNWSNKSVTGGSSAVYAGNSAGSNNSVQIRSNNNNSGVVSTTSGGTISKVTLTWNSNTPNTESLVRKVEVYGSNSAYTQATDLYDDGKKGTLLGTITRHLNETEITVSGNYAYIGIRSNDATIYLDNIAIEWVTGSLDTYSEYCTTVPSSAQITVSAAGYATYYNSASKYVMPANMEGYVWYDGKLEKGFDAGNVVPAGEPLVLKAAQGTYTLNFTDNAATQQYKADGMNALEGTDTQTAITADNDYHFYGLSLNAEGELSSVGFYWMNATGAAFTNGAHKAYLKLAKTSTARGAYLFNDATGINAVNNAQLTVNNAPAYNLAGQRVAANQKGIVIINGKKYMNK